MLGNDLSFGGDSNSMLMGAAEVSAPRPASALDDDTVSGCLAAWGKGTCKLYGLQKSAQPRFFLLPISHKGKGKKLQF